jgi:D-galactonate transporter
MPTPLSESIPATSNLKDKIESIYARVTWRLMPLLLICYVVAYLDRVNVGFAKLQMLGDLKFSESVYGLGAGMFFVGYYFFEIPSNLILHRMGARRWIARIMVTWGLISALMAWVHTPMTFYGARFLLGAAEAGFFPGMILYLTYWYPAHRRGKMVAFLMAGNPIAGIIGGPLSGWIMQSLSGKAGWSGWQWLFVLEALPAISLGIFVFFFMDDGIKGAKWLAPEEKDLLSAEIAGESNLKTVHSLRSVFTSARVWLLCLILFGIVMGSYGFGFWLPTIIKESGVSRPLDVGLLTMIPYIAALICMILTGRSADRRRERRWHVAVPSLLASTGLVMCALTSKNTGLAMIGLTLTAMGIITALPMFWALPTSFLGGAGAAAGIALINSTGNLAGFFSPSIIGWIKDYTHSIDNGLYLIAGCLAMSAVLILTLIPPKLVNR